MKYYYTFAIASTGHNWKGVYVFASSEQNAKKAFRVKFPNAHLLYSNTTSKTQVEHLENNPDKYLILKAD
jgi:hypothetical protein